MNFIGQNNDSHESFLFKTLAQISEDEHNFESRPTSQI